MEAKLNVAKQINHAFRTSGFFYGSGHGIDLKEMFKKTTEFHQKVSDEEKYILGNKSFNKSNIKQARIGYQRKSSKKPFRSFLHVKSSIQRRTSND